MSHQAIVYSIATGRVRRVLDPQAVVIDTAALAALVNVQPGEAVVVRAKLPPLATPRSDGTTGQNRLHEWQAAASLLSGRVPRDLHPDVQAHVDAAAATIGVRLIVIEDRHEVVDSSGQVAFEIHACLACGDVIPGHTLRVKNP